MAVSDYDTTPGNNTSISGVNIAEGCSPGNLNDAVRQLMADIASWDADIPKVGDTASITGTWTFTAATITTATINGGTITGADVTVGVGKTLDVSGGTLTLADDQIAGAKVAAATDTTEGVVRISTTAENETGTATDSVPHVAGVLEIVRGNGWVYTSEQTLTGTSDFDFTVPTWATEVEVLIDGLSYSAGTADSRLQIGDSGGIESTGYVSVIDRANVETSNATAFLFTQQYGATKVYTGKLHLSRWGRSSNLWIFSSVIADETDTFMMVGAGSKTLSGGLTTVRVAASGNTFDAGTAIVRYR